MLTGWDTKASISLITTLTCFHPRKAIWRTSSINSEMMVQVMSLKNRDEHNRWRSKTVAFRVSPEENEQINAAVALSGLPKQEYCYRRCMNRDIVVQGNPKVYKALRNQLAAVLDELKRIEAAGELRDELLDNIELITRTLYGMKEGSE